MVAYSFKARFADPIRAGLKTQTIRNSRNRHARAGEMLQLFTGMRTAQCKKICADVRCMATYKVTISFDHEGEIDCIMLDGVKVANIELFAVDDGFKDSSEMAQFWREEHGNLREKAFFGVLIEWDAPRDEAFE